MAKACDMTDISRQLVQPAQGMALCPWAVEMVVGMAIVVAMG